MSSFSTTKAEIGGQIERMGRIVSPPADQLFPIPYWQKSVLLGVTPYTDLQKYLSGTNSGEEERSLDEKYSVMCELNRFHKRHMSKASKSLGLDFNDLRTKQDLINSTILWAHAAGEPDFGEDASQFKAMQSQVRQNHGDTMKTLEALHTLMYAEKSKAWASLFLGSYESLTASERANINGPSSSTRVRYTTEHWNLGVDTMEDAINHDLDERRWTAVESFIDDHHLADLLQQAGGMDDGQTEASTGSAEPGALSQLGPQDFVDGGNDDDADQGAEE